MRSLFGVKNQHLSSFVFVIFLFMTHSTTSSYCNYLVPSHPFAGKKNMLCSRITTFIKTTLTFLSDWELFLEAWRVDFITTWFRLFLLLLSPSFGSFVLSFVNLIMNFFFLKYLWGGTKRLKKCWGGFLQHSKLSASAPCRRQKIYFMLVSLKHLKFMFALT